MAVPDMLPAVGEKLGPAYKLLLLLYYYSEGVNTYLELNLSHYATAVN